MAEAAGKPGQLRQAQPVFQEDSPVCVHIVRLFPFSGQQRLNLRFGIAAELGTAPRNHVPALALDILKHRGIERPDGVDDLWRFPVQELAEFRLEQLLAARIKRRACDFILTEDGALLLDSRL